MDTDGVTLNSMADVQKFADDKGMAVVSDDTTTDDLESQFHDCVIEADELSAAADPETEPFKSKYKANEVMIAMHKQLLAQKLISQVNAKRVDHRECGRMVALLDYRIGANHMVTEEPHNAQVRLEDALNFFVPSLVDEAMAISEPREEGEEVEGAAEGAAEEGEEGDEADEPRVVDVTEEEEAKERAAAAPPPAAPPAPAASVFDDGGRLSLSDSCVLHGEELVDTLNQLGILWSNRGETGRAFKFLQGAETAYAQLLEERKAGRARASPSQRKRLEALHTHTLFFLAQVAGHRGDAAASASYCAQTLQRQLEPAYEGLDVADWVGNCVTLSSFFQSQGGFLKAAACLAACRALFEREGVGAEALAADEPLAACHADVDRKLGMLYCAALQLAREARVLGAELPPTDAPTLSFAHLSAKPVDAAPLDAAAMDYTAACAAFKAGHAALARALKFYVLDGHASDHVELLQQQSALYKCVAAFEPDEKKQLAMHSRRVALLGAVGGELNERVFHATCCQLAFELGEAYSEMLDLKMARVDAKAQLDAAYAPTKAERAKINGFATEGMRHFGSFVRLLNQLLSGDPHGKGGSPPPPTAWGGDNAESLGPYLRAHFHYARLVGRFLDTEVEVAVGHMKASLDKYAFLAGYVAASREAAEQPDLFEQEREICVQMAELLPQKISQMHYKGQVSRRRPRTTAPRPSHGGAAAAAAIRRHLLTLRRPLSLLASSASALAGGCCR